MKEQKPCKRGNLYERDRWGHCLCIDCKLHRCEVNISNPKTKLYRKKWAQENKDKVRNYVKKWNNENKEKRKSIVESWRRRNPEKVAIMSSKAGKKWHINNRDKRAVINARRRAILLNQLDPNQDINKIKSFYEEARRITKETGIPHEVDHIIPLQGEKIRGLHTHTNLQIITRHENRSKKNKTIC